jgi:hypothetical protein
LELEELTLRDVVYVTKMKQDLTSEGPVDCMDMMPKVGMQHREQVVVSRTGEVNHLARIIT